MLLLKVLPLLIKWCQIKSKIDNVIPIENNNCVEEITKAAKIILTIISQFFIAILSNLAKQLETKYKKRERRASNQIKDIK